jgi:hypothetical protein
LTPRFTDAKIRQSTTAQQVNTMTTHETGQEAVMAILLRNGGSTLCWASEENHESIVKMLLSAGADPNVKDRNGNTSLHRASDKGHASVVKALLSAGADPNIKNDDGSTPLHAASTHSRDSVAQMLLCAGADPNARDCCGEVPLHWASILGCEAGVTVLLSAGADPTVENNDGVTPDGIALGGRIKDRLRIPFDAPELRICRRDMKKMKSEMMGGLQSMATALMVTTIPRVGEASPLYPLHMAFFAEEIINLLLSSSIF